MPTDFSSQADAMLNLIIKATLDKGSMEQARREAADLMNKMANDVKGQTGGADFSPMFKKLADDIGNVGNVAKKTGLEGYFSKWTSGLTDFGAIAEGVFGGIIGVTAVQAVQKLFEMLISYLSEAAQMALVFEKSMTSMELGIRAMQRNGLDISMEGFYEEIDRVQKKFKIFSEVDVIQGSSVFVNNMREMGVSVEQLSTVMDISGKIAILSGKSYEETATVINRAVVTGYARTLNSVMKGTVVTERLAQKEAERLGILDKTYSQMSAQERTMVVISLLSREIAKYGTDIEDVTEKDVYELTESQQILEKQKTLLGESILPIWNYILKIITTIVTELSASLGFIIGLFSTIIQLAEVAEKFIEGFLTTGTIEGAAEAANAKWEELKKTIMDTLNAALRFFTLGALGNQITPGMVDVPESEKGKYAEDDSDLVTQEEKDSAEERLSIEKSYAESSVKIEEDRVDKIEDAAIDLARKLEDIDRDLARDLEKAARKLEFDLDSINIDAANRKAEAQRKYAEKELEAAQRLQDQLRELREKAIFDLEESLRRGDIRQARLILRQYRFDKKQLNEKANNASRDRAQEYAAELADIERQREQRRKERLIEYAQQLDDMNRQAAYAREDANRAYKQKLADIELWNRREIEANRAKYEQELRDLQAKLNAEIAMEQKAADTITAIHAAEAHVGVVPNSGTTAQERADATGYTRGLNGANNTNSIVLGGGSVPTTGSASVGDWISNVLQSIFGAFGFAKGGTVVASKPTVAMFGEAGTEMATFTPISQMGRNQGNVGGSGKLALEILLSPDLQARIIQNTLTEMGNIITSVERSR
jgi:hypothetical protein